MVRAVRRRAAPRGGSAWLLVVLIVIAGCGGTEPQPRVPSRAPTVSIQLTVDPRSTYVEGAVTSIVLRNLRGRNFNGAGAVYRYTGALGNVAIERGVLEGDHSLDVGFRACPGSCQNLGRLGRLTDECRARVSVAPTGQTKVRVHAVPGEPCRIREY